MAYPSPPGQKAPLDSRVFALVAQLIPTPLESLPALSAFGEASADHQGIHFARVLSADEGAVVIEFAPESASRNWERVYRLKCELASKRASLLPLWRGGARVARSHGLQNRAGIGATARNLGQCYFALQEAQALHGTFHAQQKDNS